LIGGVFAGLAKLARVPEKARLNPTKNKNLPGVRGVEVGKCKIPKILFIYYLSYHHNVVDSRQYKLSIDSKDAQERVLYLIVIIYSPEPVLN
jgi:hypothetical protein